jgi:hypothetical protein
LKVVFSVNYEEDLIVIAMAILFFSAIFIILGSILSDIANNKKTGVYVAGLQVNP